eukprot:scaffold81109_cov36-Prasinocladus_malaysianus.AAC.1
MDSMNMIPYELQALCCLPGAPSGSSRAGSHPNSRASPSVTQQQSPLSSCCSCQMETVIQARGGCEQIPCRWRRWRAAARPGIGGT